MAASTATRTSPSGENAHRAKRAVAPYREPLQARHGDQQGAHLADTLEEILPQTMVAGTGAERVWYATSGLSVGRFFKGIDLATDHEVRPIAAAPVATGAAPAVWLGSSPARPETDAGATFHRFAAASTEEAVLDAVRKLGYDTFSPGIVVGRWPADSLAPIRALGVVATEAAVEPLLPIFAKLEVVTRELLGRARQQLNDGGESDALDAVVRAVSAARSLAVLLLNPP